MIMPAAQNSLLEAVRDFAINHLKATDITTVEDEIGKIVRTIANTMMQEAATKMSGKPTYSGARISCKCGKKAEFKGYRSRWIKTLHGEAEVSRGYYRCPGYGQGYIPWDKAQGLNARVWTPRVNELVATTCAALPYKAALGLVERTTGLVIEESSGEDMSSDYAPERLYISIDAAKAHTDGEWHDIKTAVIYEGKRIEGNEIDTVNHSQYVAVQEKSDDFGRRIYTKAMQAGYDKAHLRIVLADGGEWIWNEVRNHFPKSIKILDYFHACEHIYSLAKVLYGEESPKGKRWAKEHCDKLKKLGPASLLRSINFLARYGINRAEKLYKSAS